jgi:hypothetical protein
MSVERSSEQKAGRSKRPWNKQEDHVIFELVAKHGTNSWTKIAQELIQLAIGLERSGKQCRTR